MPSASPGVATLVKTGSGGTGAGVGTVVEHRSALSVEEYPSTQPETFTSEEDDDDDDDGDNEGEEEEEEEVEEGSSMEDRDHDFTNGSTGAGLLISEGAEEKEMSPETVNDMAMALERHVCVRDISPSLVSPRSSLKLASLNLQ